MIANKERKGEKDKKRKKPYSPPGKIMTKKRGENGLARNAFSASTDHARDK